LTEDAVVYALPRGAANVEGRWGHGSSLTQKQRPGGLPILPLDGLTCVEVRDPSGDFAVDVRAISFDDWRNADPVAQTRFRDKAKWTVWVRPTQDAVIEVYYTEDAQTVLLTKARTVVSRNETWHLTAANGKAPELDFDPNETRPLGVTVFAFPAKDPSAMLLSPGTLLEQKGIHSRVLHRSLYPLPRLGMGFGEPNPEKLTKTSVFFSVLDPRGK
jgi:hypothetical protein